LKKFKQELSQLICDACDLKVSKNSAEFDEFICIEHKCGDGTIHGKGNLLTVDFCQKCFAKICFDHFTLSDVEDMDI
jgi:hypothetical protein